MATGWVRIEEAEYSDELGDPASTPREDVLEAVRAVMEQLVPALPFEAAPAQRPYEPRFGPEALFRTDNGVWTVLVDTHRNHRHDWPVALFTELARVAPGSFGFLHVHDDEHPTESDRFMRWTMLSGEITVQEDATLRPVISRWFDSLEP